MPYNFNIETFSKVNNTVEHLGIYTKTGGSFCLPGSISDEDSNIGDYKTFTDAKTAETDCDNTPGCVGYTYRWEGKGSKYGNGVGEEGSYLLKKEITGTSPNKDFGCNQKTIPTPSKLKPPNKVKLFSSAKVKLFSSAGGMAKSLGKGQKPIDNLIQAAKAETAKAVPKKAVIAEKPEIQGVISDVGAPLNENSISVKDKSVNDNTEQSFLQKKKHE
jgi:hypothetical protein